MNIGTATITASLLTLSLTTVFVAQASPYDHGKITAEDLWKYLAQYEEKTGGRAMAIPHNGNLSNGLMFNGKTFKGKKITRDYAERRARWEPLFEMTQMKRLTRRSRPRTSLPILKTGMSPTSWGQ